MRQPSTRSADPTSKTKRNENPSTKFAERPSAFPDKQIDGRALKPLPEVLRERRATEHFDSQFEVPEVYLNAILNFAGQAPSGYNLQPWRFIVVRDLANRQRLQKVAFGQPKIAEAPVVIIALGMKEEVKKRAAEIFREGLRRGIGKPEKLDATINGALKFLGTQQMEAWVNRHVMIAVTTMMLVAEAYGFDTAPMEGFDEAGVKREFNVADEASVVALLAIGRRSGPDKAYPGRFDLDEIVFQEKFVERVTLQ
jgi:nitroreductase